MTASTSDGSRRSICCNTKITFLSQRFCNSSRNCHALAPHGLTTENTNTIRSACGTNCSVIVWWSATMVFVPGVSTMLKSFRNSTG